MTFIDVIYFLINCFLAVVVGIVLSGVYYRFTHEKIGAVLLALAGAGLGFWLALRLMEGLRKLIDGWYHVFPLRPPCRNGNCGSDDYQWDAAASGPLKGDVFICKCGDRYLRKARCFDLLTPDGTREPYMRRHLLIRRWSRS
jgi:hypothetical protein